MDESKGFTLLELVVTVAIIALLLSIATLLYSQLNMKYQVESTIKEIYGTMIKMRNDAALSNTPHLVLFNANQVLAGRDADDNGAIDGAPISTINTGFTVNCGIPPAIAACAGFTVTFNRRGIPNNLQTVSLAIPANVPSSLNCISIAVTRINIGRFEGGNCVQQ